MLKSQKIHLLHSQKKNQQVERNVVVFSRMFSRGIMGYRTKYKGLSSLAILEGLAL